VINDEAITLLDPLSAVGQGRQVSFIRCRWAIVAKLELAKDAVRFSTVCFIL
jgi:hypothetical protein